MKNEVDEVKFEETEEEILRREELKKEREMNSIGYAKDNDGNLLLDYPMRAMGEMVILENNSKTADPNQTESYGGLNFSSEQLQHGEVGGWTVVAVGEYVSRIKKGQLVGNPIGNSITPIQHPLIARKVEIKDRNGNMIIAGKNELDHVYVVVNQQLIGMIYEDVK